MYMLGSNSSPCSRPSHAVLQASIIHDGLERDVSGANCAATFNKLASVRVLHSTALRVPVARAIHPSIHPSAVATRHFQYSPVAHLLAADRDSIITRPVTDIRQRARPVRWRQSRQHIRIPLPFTHKRHVSLAQFIRYALFYAVPLWATPNTKAARLLMRQLNAMSDSNNYNGH